LTVAAKTSHASQLSVSLDRPVGYGESTQPDYGVAKVVVPAALIGGAVLVAVMSEVDLAGPFRGLKSLRDTTLKRAGASASNVKARLGGVLKKRPPKGKTYLPADEWSPLILESRETLGASGCSKYTFDLSHKAALFGLELGETLRVMALEEDGVTIQSTEVVPCSPRSLTGTVSIVINDRTDPCGAILSRMDEGEPVAGRPGEKKLTYDGPEDVAISDLQCIVSGPDAVPAIEMLRELLGSGESSIEVANLVWVNSKQEDFVLYSDAEALWEKHDDVLELACVVEQDLTGPGLFTNEACLEVMPKEFVPGTMVVLAGPQEFTRNVKSKLLAAGFPPGVIVSL